MKCTICKVLAIVLLCVVDVAARHSQHERGATAISKEQVLARWANALGGRENLQNVHTIHMRGSVEMGGMQGTFERWTTERGEFRTAVDIGGVFRQMIVFDGQKGWMEDKSGTVRELSVDTFKSVVSSAYEASDSFLFSGRLPGEVEFAGEDANQDAYALRLEARGGNVETVYLDKQSFLPSREESGGPTGNRVITLSDWRDFGGVKLPGTIRQSNGDSRFDAILTTEKVEINPPVLVHLFDKPAAATEPIQFDKGAHDAVIPAEVYGEHVYVPVRVNGSEARWFFLDSGAGISVVSNALAQEAGLAIEGSIGTTGTGSGSTSMGLAKNVVLDLPGARVPPSTVAVWDLSSILPMLGRRWDGNVGYDVISRLVVRVDYEHKQVAFSDPATFVPNAKAASLPVTFVGNIPLIHVKIGLPGRAPADAVCAVDSGADGFHLTTPFTNANHVLEAVRKKVLALSFGIGGESKQFAGRITSLQLGPYVLRGPIVAFSPDEKGGLLASGDFDGLIGGEILKRFAVTFDYPHHRILQQNRRAIPVTILRDGRTFEVKLKLWERI